MPESKDIRQLLKRELKRRVLGNPSYSLRAFARSLHISRSFLSLLLKGERSVSNSMLFKIAERLRLDQNQIEKLRQHRSKLRQKIKLKQV